MANPNKSLIMKCKKVKGNMSAKNAKLDIETAASEALRVLSMASESAAKTIADAAGQATAVIANAAAEAAKLASAHAAKNSTDHDLLLGLIKDVAGLKEDINRLRDDQKRDIKELKDDTIEKVNTHERRLNSIYSSNTRLVVCVSFGALWLCALSAMLIYHLFKMPIQ
jgi:hypothetical protein